LEGQKRAKFDGISYDFKLLPQICQERIKIAKKIGKQIINYNLQVKRKKW